MGKATTLSDISWAAPPGQRWIGKSLEQPLAAVSATLLALEYFTSPKKKNNNQKGISHKEMLFVLKTPSPANSSLKPAQEKRLPGCWVSGVAEGGKAAWSFWDNHD